MRVNLGENVFPVVNEKFLEALDDKARTETRNDGVQAEISFHLQFPHVCVDCMV